jgi:hypothetical protein
MAISREKESWFVMIFAVLVYSFPVMKTTGKGENTLGFALFI